MFFSVDFACDSQVVIVKLNSINTCHGRRYQCKFVFPVDKILDTYTRTMKQGMLK